MRSLLIALIAAVCAMSASAEEQESAPKDMVLLTVSGTIGETNRGVLDAKKDSLLALQKVDFPRPSPSTAPCCSRSSRER